MKNYVNQKLNFIKKLVQEKNKDLEENILLREYDNVYYVHPNSDLNLFNHWIIKEDKSYIIESVFYLDYPDNLIDNKKSKLSETYLDFNNYNNINIIYEKIVMVTYWPHSYGHIFDSLFVLYNFNLSIPNNYKYLLFIPLKFTNLIELAIFFFGNNFINSADLDHSQLIKINKLILIKNHANDMKNFQKYNNNIIKQKIRNYYDSNSIEQYENIFLTRSINSLHDKNSTLDNLNEIEDFFKNINFKIIDPEKTTDRILYNNIKCAKNIVTTNGSALSSLIILEPCSKIFILNSKRYLPDWRKNCKNNEEVQQLIKNNNLLLDDDFEKKLWYPTLKKFNYIYIDSFMNIISIEQLNYIKNNLNL